HRGLAAEAQRARCPAALPGAASYDRPRRGGCCGTTPEHIAAIARVMRSKAPRALPGRPVAVEPEA
ncbi:homocysteine S-methyltransferase family protein, partial [Burkholderia gladioli]|nr:homocysteine S-methyltransferase family protein [Burkholderia gladioli]